MSIANLLLTLSGLLGGLSVILGAFAAHALKHKLTENLLSAFETGVQYQFIHALAIAMVVILARLFPHTLWYWSASAMSLGVVLFSGSLYLLALTGMKWFGPITPIGGIAFIVGWGLFVVAAIKSSQ